MGYGTAVNNTSSSNVGLGYNALSDADKPRGIVNGGNVSIGYETQNVAESCGYNVAIGYRTARTLEVQYNSIFIGNEAGYTSGTSVKNGSSFYNIAIGTKSMANITDSSQNIAIGTNSMSNFSGSSNAANNISIGNNSACNISTGFSNICVGELAGSQIGSTSSNIFIGHKSGQDATSGNKNIILGNNSGKNGIGSCNIIIGENNANLYNGNDNYIIGGSNNITSGKRLTGNKNLIFANSSCKQITGNSNLIYGISQATTSITGSRNLVFGMKSSSDLSGNDNIIIGTSNVTSATNSSSNIIIGNGITNLQNLSNQIIIDMNSANVPIFRLDNRNTIKSAYIANTTDNSGCGLWLLGQKQSQNSHWFIGHDISDTVNTLTIQYNDASVNDISDYPVRGTTVASFTSSGGIIADTMSIKDPSQNTYDISSGTTRFNGTDYNHLTSGSRTLMAMQHLYFEPDSSGDTFEITPNAQVSHLFIDNSDNYTGCEILIPFEQSVLPNIQKIHIAYQSSSGSTSDLTIKGIDSTGSISTDNILQQIDSSGISASSNSSITLSHNDNIEMSIFRTRNNYRYLYKTN